MTEPDRIGPGGGLPLGHPTTPSPSSEGALSELLSVLRQCKGAPYRFWNDGGDGMHNQTVADVQRTGESCSGLFVFAFRKIGVTPPFHGTYDAKANIENRQPYDANKDYPIGTFVVGVDPGTEGHMVMVSGAGNTIIESSHGSGVNEGKNLHDVVNAAYDMKDPVTGTFHAIGTQHTAGGDLANAGSWFAGIGEEIASGVAKALIRFIRALYCLTILWPIDWLSGFFWELTKQVAGFWVTASEGVDLLAILKGESDVKIPPMPSIQQGDLTSEENVNRFYTLLLVILTYMLAFGYNRNNEPHLDNLFNLADNANTNKGRKGYNEEATISAEVSRSAGEPTIGPDQRSRDAAVDRYERNRNGGGNGNGTRPKQPRDEATQKFIKSRTVETSE